MRYHSFSDIILEAQNYNQMFSKIFDVAKNLDQNAEDHIREDIEQNISWAKSVLKKNDRIVWFLRLIKLHWLERLNSMRFTNVEQDKVLEISKILKREIDITKSKSNVNSYRDYQISNVVRSLEHFLSLDRVSKIQNHTWSNESPNNLLGIFRGYEREWQEESTDSGVSIREGDTLLIPFDGGSKAWWLLSRGACRDEADAMGHCGNVPSQKSGDRIISFRIKSDNNLWTPKLTFILHKDGYLGEMKGRANEKPAARYHPYIVELLKNDIIKGIRGGGYASENNFSLEDLSENVRKDLIDLKPSLGSLVDLVEKYGSNHPDVILRVKNILEETISFKSFNEDTGEFVVMEWKDATELVDDRGNDTAKWVAGIVSGNDDLNWSSYDVDDRQIKDFLETIVSKEKKEKKNDTIELKIKSWLAENEPYDPEEDDWIDYVIDNDVTQVINAVKWAIDDGNRAGAESEMYKYFYNAVGDYGVDGELLIGDLKFSRNEDGSIDYWSPIQLIITAEDIAKLTKSANIHEDGDIADYLADIENDGYFEKELTITEPYYGFSGYEEDVAIESFYERLDEEL